jgi:hypothetical protein
VIITSLVKGRQTGQTSLLIGFNHKTFEQEQQIFSTDFLRFKLNFVTSAGLPIALKHKNMRLCF